jgi:hypothetical protein
LLGEPPAGTTCLAAPQTLRCVEFFNHSARQLFVAGAEPDVGRAGHGFSGFLEALWAEPSLFVGPAAAALRRLLTFGERLPLEHGIEALSDLDRHLYEALAARPGIALRREPPAAGGGLRLSANSQGRLHLRPAGEAPPDYGPQIPTRTLAWIDLPPGDLARAARAAESDAAEEAALRREIDALYGPGGELADTGAALDLVDDAVRHVEAVSFYVDDEAFVLVDGCCTLIDRSAGPGLFSRLRGQPAREWTPAQRLGVAALRALFLSGRSIRFEEFSGKQLTARRLFARLRGLAESYTRLGAAPPPGRGFGDLGLLNLARAVGAAAQLSVGSPGRRYLRYREVYGVTFLKTERLMPAASARRIPLPPRLRDLADVWLGRRPREDEGPEGADRIVEELAAAALAPGAERLPLEPGTPAGTPVEALMQELVVAALLDTDSDYAMSSSLRDLRHLQEPDPRARLLGIAALKPRLHFFCCIASRPGLSQLLGERLAAHVYDAVQARMEFNRWHFLPGNFHDPGPWGPVPRTRHWFFPPVTPDLAEWSDLRHNGHTRGGVRYSIRSPGPDMGEPPLLIAGHPYRGFYDIRVVRMEGPPYTPEEMLRVRRHRLWLGIVWRRIVERCEAEPGAVVVTGFSTGHGYEPAPLSGESPAVPLTVLPGDSPEERPVEPADDERRAALPRAAGAVRR